ncbi:hypothetical protein J2S43_003195 [Catenuloplanes nepalensis]|uniref:Uncharacterized protein n=1 Tax=Catenuloplanes nepalensis TaxID=587533 RepID=A0ABT9MTH5_9ACTN|nr:hypothetical protein [Catenuloplanes nepalensis]MDP9794683.1 hypothetical protein [Catenuloplanes nepalensis]
MSRASLIPTYRSMGFTSVSRRMRAGRAEFEVMSAGTADITGPVRRRLLRQIAQLGADRGLDMPVVRAQDRETGRDPA